MQRARFFRTIVVGSVSLALVVGASALTRASAQEGAGFRNGRADAVGTVFGAAPGVGSLSLGINAGVAVSQLTNTLAQSQAKVLDLGLIGTSLTAEQCDGSPGSVRPDQLPQPSTADNRHGDASVAKDEYPIAGSALAGGHQEAEATTKPSARASTTGVNGTLGPLVSVRGARADATSQVIDGKARQAEALVTMDIDIAGVAQLHGLRWDARHRTGDSPDVAGTFSIASSTVDGAPLPSDQLGPLQDALNAALAPSGITIAFPTVQHLTSPNELIRVTPLTITLKDSPLGKALVGPGLNLTREQRGQLFDAIVGAYCKAASLLLVGDIATDVVSGTGFMTVTFGGAEASSGDTVLGNPFGVGDLLPVPPDSGAVLPPGGPSGVTSAPGSAAAPIAATTAGATGPLDHVCETLHLSKHPGCSHGAGWPLGLLGLAATGVVGYLDWRRQRPPAAAEATA